MSNATSPSAAATLPKSRRLFPSFFPEGHDWKRKIAASGLPDEIKNLIFSVVSGSRLFRFEKAEVAAELISHFHEGRQRGKAYSALAENFGDPTVTATLIRRSKIRNRPMFMKVFKGLGFGAGGLAAAYLGILAFFHLGQTNPTIDYLTDFNANVSDAEESERAWLIYQPAWKKAGFCEGGGCKLEEIYVKTEDGSSELVRPTDEGWDEAVATLAKYEYLLDAIREGAKRPHLGLKLQSDPLKYSDEDFATLFPGADKENYTYSAVWNEYDENARRIMKGSLISILLPHVQSFRKAARAFHVDTRLAMEQGDSQRVVENIETVFSIADHAAEAQCLVCSLVGFAVTSIGFNMIEEVIESDDEFLSDEQLARLQARVEDIDIKSMIHYEGERASIKDLIQRSYTDDGNGDGRMTADGVAVIHLASSMMVSQLDESGMGSFANTARGIIAPAALFACASRKELTEKTDEFIDDYIADIEVPCWISRGVDHEDELQDNKFKYMLLGMMLPAAPQVKTAAYRTIGRQEGVLAALAIHRYYKRNGEWPTEVDQLAPEFITEFPVDQADGSLVKFNYDEGSLTVYSVGQDRDDDGGVFKGKHGRAHYIFGGPAKTDKGDWILWPQQEPRVSVSATDDASAAN